jgi:acetyl esterase/lipase
MRIPASCLFALVLALLPSTRATADDAGFSRTKDVVYGRKHGMALTLDVFTPKGKSNGLGVIFVVSGGWFSAHEAITPGYLEPLLKRGYTLFAVVHGSQPRYTIPEAIDDLNRATRFVRYHAKDYKVDPDHLGIYGLSAGGHLSLMQATAGDLGKPNPIDPIGRTSSRVQAVACFFPPTDFLNYGKAGENAMGVGTLHAFRAPFDFHEFDPKQNLYVPIKDESRIHQIGHDISPITHVSKDDPPTLILHGDADKLVPIQQAEIMVKKLTDAGVEAKLVVKPGAGHGWADLHADIEKIADWFDAHLKTTH